MAAVTLQPEMKVTNHSKEKLKMYLLKTSHNPPKFYNVQGQAVSAELRYISKLEKSYLINEEVHRYWLETTTDLSSEGDWMVSCPRQALAYLRKLEVHPFKNKNDAKQFAHEKGLSSFLYLKV